MANVNAANGLSPVGTIGAGSWNQQANMYVIQSADTSQYGVGDIVLSDSYADIVGIPGVKKAASTDVPRGVIVGILQPTPGGPSLQGVPLALETIPIPGTKARDYYVLVVDDPDTIFEVQCNNTSTLTLSSTINNNAKPLIANPASGSPFSGTQVDSANIGTTNTFMLKIVGMPLKPGMDNTAYARLLVKFNTHELFGSTTGV